MIVGLLVERRFGSFAIFVNGENLTNVLQSSWGPILRPQRGVDGRWTVDAWAPLEGRVINGGVRVYFSKNEARVAGWCRRGASPT